MGKTGEQVVGPVIVCLVFFLDCRKCSFRRRPNDIPDKSAVSR